jgi:pimeloyl-ACP methyl ester carboxylesterase
MKAHRYHTSHAGWQAMMAWYEQKLARFSVPISSQFVNTRYGCTHIITAGDRCAPPIILLHGTNVNMLGWQAQIEGLSEQYYLIAPDVIGYAGKSDPVRLSYRTPDYAFWLMDVLDALQVSSAVLIGSSAGGFFALHFAYHCPQYVRAVILLNPCGIVPFRFPLNIMRQIPIAYTVGFFSRRMASYWLAKKLAQKNVAPNTQPNPENIHLAYLILKHYIRHHPPGTLQPRQLRQINTPTLLLVSQHEPFLPLRHMLRRATRLMPHIQAHIVDGAGHDIHVERPDFINASIHHFIASLS